MSDPIETFIEERKDRIRQNESNAALQKAAQDFNLESNKAQYSYNFSWMGRPIIQYPQDMVAMQEIIWDIKPDLIIETGIAHGGSLIYYASLLELIGKGEKHPMFARIKMIQGSSVSAETVAEVNKYISGKEKVLVCLDSNHTHEHVLNEIRMYSRFVTVGSYLVVFDTIVETMPDNYLPGRPWTKGNNPMSAVREFLKSDDKFIVDTTIDNKLLISVAPGGYLRKVK